MKEYTRKPLKVQAVEYELGKGMEDGFEPWFNVVTNSWINTDFLVKVKREDGVIVCPYITNKRGRVFIGEGDYIIYEENSERHVCGREKFDRRFDEI